MLTHFSNRNYISTSKKMATFSLFMFVLLMPGIANASLLSHLLGGATKTVRHTTGAATDLVHKTTVKTPLAPIVNPVTKDMTKIVNQTTDTVEISTDPNPRNGAQNGNSSSTVSTHAQLPSATSTDIQLAASKGLANSLKPVDTLLRSSSGSSDVPSIPFVAKVFAFPILLSFLNWLYLSIQSHIDRKEPKLAKVPEERDLYFS